MTVPGRYVPAVEQATFVLAMGLLAGAVFLYIRDRNLLTPLGVITLSVAGFAVARILLWPDSLPLRFALERKLLPRPTKSWPGCRLSRGR